MANFTINSLATSQINDSDKLLKSDTNGALTNTTLSDVKNYVFNDTTLPVKSDYNARNGDPYPVNNNDFVNKQQITTTSGAKNIATIEFDIKTAGRYIVGLIAPLAVTGAGSAMMTVKIDDRPDNLLEIHTNSTTMQQYTDISYRFFEPGHRTATITINYNISGATLDGYLNHRFFVMKA